MANFEKEKNRKIIKSGEWRSGEKTMMPTFENDQKMRWVITTACLGLVLIVLVVLPNDPYAFVAIGASVVGGFLIVGTKLFHKLKSKKLNEWGDAGVELKHQKYYSLGYVLIAFALAYTTYAWFSN